MNLLVFDMKITKHALDKKWTVEPSKHLNYLGGGNSFSKIGTSADWYLYFHSRLPPKPNPVQNKACKFYLY